MLRIAAWVAATALGGLALYRARHKLRLALRLALLLYALLFLWRLSQATLRAEELKTMALVAVVFLGLWTTVWLATRRLGPKKP